MTSRVAAVAICLCINIVSAAFSQTCPEPVGEWGYGPTRSVAVKGDIAVMDSGPKLLVVDLQASPEPAVVGELALPNDVQAIAMQGSTVYVLIRHTDTENPRLLTVDVTDPSSPAHLGSLEISESFPDVAVQGDFAYISSTTGGLTIIDVGDPTAPRGLSELPSVGSARGIAVQGHFAYVATHENLCVVNISRPAEPFVETRKEAPPGADVALTPALLYHLTWEGLVVFDIADPADPQRRGVFTDIREPTAVAAVDHTVYVADWADWSDISRLLVIDAEDPSLPSHIGQFQQSGRMDGVATGDGVLLAAASEAGSRLFDLADPSNPELTLELSPPAAAGFVSDMVVSDGLAFLAAEWDSEPTTSSAGGLRIVDVSDETAFTEIVNLELAAAGYNIAFYGDHVVVVRGDENELDLGLDVIEVSEPANPALIGSLEFSGWPSNQLVVSGDYAFITNEGLMIVDLADPIRPVAVSFTSAPGSGFQSVAVVDDRAYLAAGQEGLCVYDLTDLHRPEELSCAPTLSWAHWLAVSEGRAYVTAGRSSEEHQLLIFDITGQGPPSQIGSFALGDTGRRVSISGRLAYVETPQRGLLVIDVADPVEPVLLGIVPEEGWGIGAGDRLYTITDWRYLHGFDVSSCLNSLPTADFSWQPNDPLLGEEIQFSDTSGGAPTSWLWDFGDGNTSREQLPHHVYAVPGEHTVSLTVENQVGTDTAGREVRVFSIASRSHAAYVLPAAAHGAGKAGTEWRSDLVIDVPDSKATVAAYFAERGQDNTLQPGKRLVLERGSTSFDDVLATLFDEHDTAGSIVLTANTGLVISSRTYTLSGDGSFGQFIPAVTGYDYSEPSVLTQLTQNGDFRTNLGLVNLEEHPIEASVEVFAADRTSLGAVTYTIEPFGHIQINEFIADITDDPVDDGYAHLNVSPLGPPVPVDVPTGGGAGVDGASKLTPPPLIRHASYASTVDNLTGDPVFMLPSIPSRHPLWVPAVAHVNGRNGTMWHTDLEVCCDQGGDARFRLELLESGRANTDPPTETLTLESGRCARYRDVVESVFGRSATGALKVVPEMGVVTASSRTFTRRADGGTYGQYVASVPDFNVAAYYSFVHLVQLSQSADQNHGFRTNVGLVNASPIAIEVELRIQTRDLVTIDEQTVELRPFEHRQFNRILQGLSDEDLEDVRIRVWTTTFAGRFLAYASVVDNVSGDAMYVPGQ